MRIQFLLFSLFLFLFLHSSSAFLQVIESSPPRCFDFESQLHRYESALQAKQKWEQRLSDLSSDFYYRKSYPKDPADFNEYFQQTEAISRVQETLKQIIERDLLLRRPEFDFVIETYHYTVYVLCYPTPCQSHDPPRLRMLADFCIEKNKGGRFELKVGFANGTDVTFEAYVRHNYPKNVTFVTSTPEFPFRLC